jgi:histidinol dehydrogenase
VLRRITVEQVLAARCPAVEPEALEVARGIVEDVERRGEAAVTEHARRLGELGPGDGLFVERRDLVLALDRLGGADRSRLERVAGRIRRFAEAQLGSQRDLSLAIPGATVGHRLVPLRAAGCYVPGGRHPLPSSALMTVIPARVAGVPTVWVASPRPQPITLAAAALAGADGVLAAGGAQAVAALAFGCGPMPPCDIVVGPGNVYVTAAKFLLSRRTAIDALAGPSEVVILADQTTDAATAASDLLAQAEHDPRALPVVIALDAGVVAGIGDELARQLQGLPTAEVARAALARGGVVVVGSADQAVEACERLAPEHVQVLTRDPEALASRLTRFGTVFVGAGAAEVLGDYGAGPNHVLPTGGSAGSAAGLSVFSFLKPRTWMTSLGRADPTLAADAAWLARLEGLEAHARAAERRGG